MISLASIRRPVRIAILAVLVLLGLIYFSFSGSHTVQPELFHIPPNDRPHLSLAEATTLCRKHGFAPWTKPGRKVFDLFPMNIELDWLDIRLHTLYPHVDYFVSVEGTNTFTNLPKKAILQEHWDNFTDFHPKMRHYVVEDPIDSPRAWDHEDWYRNALMRSTFPHFRGAPEQPNEGDVIVVADIDEIPKPETWTLLRHCDFPDRLTLRSHFYYYSFQWAHRGVQWQHPQATTFHGLGKTILPTDLRNGEGGPSWGWLQFIRPFYRLYQKDNLWSASWHCSSCFGTLKEMRRKMESFSHKGLNTEENRQPKLIVERVRNGLDLFGRWGENYDRVVDNQDVPPYIMAHPELYGHMIDRDGEDAAFRDYSSFV